jgi:proline iminopeptidase
MARRMAFGALLALLAGCVHTEPFRDADGEVLPGSIASMEKLPIGGIEQSVWLRGRSTANPLLVLLHGGPGASEAPLFRAYDAALEDDFLVVYWEQRGAGRSYRRDIPPESMTIDRFVVDLDELVELLRARFGQERVVLLGHSWGSALGILYAHAHPEKVAAYAGVGQVADMAEGERLSWEHALRLARERGLADGVRELEAIGPPPHDVGDNLTSRKWNERTGGAHHGDLDMGDLVWTALRTDEANLADLARFGLGNRFSLNALWPAFRVLDLTRLQRFEVPIVFLLGRDDWQVPSALAARWFETIDAPCKRLVWFEQSGHDPPFEEPAAFVAAMREVKAIAATCRR